MDFFSSALDVAANIGPWGTFVLVIFLLVERAFERGWIRFGKQDNSQEGKIFAAIRGIADSQTLLKSHYNDDTTRILSEISMKLNDLAAIKEGQRIGFSAMNTKFQEWDKYGIKTADDK